MDNFIHGIDVSRRQGSQIKWSAVFAEGQKYTFIKTTDGVSYKEPFIQLGRNNAIAAKAAGLKIGYYHFAQPTNLGGLEADAVNEANYFLSTIENGFPAPNFPLVLDYEGLGSPISPLESKTWIETFNKVITDAGHSLILYSYKPFLDQNLPKGHGLGNIPLWIARYPSVFNPNIPPKLPNGWNSWAIWQYSAKGTSKGIPNLLVDLNIMKPEFFNKY
ncbi:MAG: glycoside hydrolase family 25 protein [Bacteroidota bacterium]|uniref:glycoside hydrolase family 25 protein n=1 Tax=Runella sp. TaxID=1960881 RepID=UPI003017A2DF